MSWKVGMVIFFNCLATLLTWFFVVQAFNPKYRYNEHCVWEPELLECSFMAIIIFFIVWRIWF